jgi:alpha-tubulin suppressor-like RCC1 family protein
VRAEDERVFCWGLNSAGQCTGKDDPSGARDTGVIAPSVTGGGRTTCALPDTSATTCWGGEFPGDGTSFQPRMAVVVDRTLETISSGSTHVCGIEAGVVYCWGENNLGQLGAPGANNPLPTAVTDPLLEEATAVAAGDSFTCVLDRDRAGVVCFGANDGGQVSPSEASMTLGPTDVGLMVPSGLTSLAAGVRHACAADASFVVCWGDNTGLAVDPGGPVGPTLPSTLSFPAGSVRQVVAGNQLSCALLDDGDIQCWGSNSNGQRGDGGSGLATPTRVSLDRAAVQISAGHQHACAITAEGELYCWGRNDSGQLGDGSSEDSDRPVLVPVPAL